MEIRQSNTPAETAGAALTETLERFAHTPVLLMLSSGSALALLEHVDTDVFGPHVTLTTLDERFSDDPTVNNFAQLQATAFYTNVRQQNAAEIPTTITPGETLDAAGRRFEASLRQWRTKHREGVIVATLGVGSDGHTAGLFPGDHGVAFSGDDWVVAYRLVESTNPYPARITVTYTFLRTQVRSTLVYAVGEKKAAVLAQLQRNEHRLEDMPASIIWQLPNDAVIVTDQSVS